MTVHVYWGSKVRSRSGLSSFILYIEKFKHFIYAKLYLNLNSIIVVLNEEHRSYFTRLKKTVLVERKNTCYNVYTNSRIQDSERNLLHHQIFISKCWCCSNNVYIVTYISLSIWLIDIGFGLESQFTFDLAIEITVIAQGQTKQF